MRQKPVEFDGRSSLSNMMKSLNENTFKEIFVFQESMKAKRLKERDSNLRMISDICDSVKRIAVDIQDSKKLQDLDINKLRGQLKNIQERIQSFKTHNELNLKKLQDEEKYLKSEVEKFTAVIDNYEKPEEVKDLPAPIMKSQYALDVKSEEVVRFEKFLLDHDGHCGGWEEEDHLLFLQLRQKYRQRSLFMRAVLIRLPGLTENAVIKHEKWYAEYLTLREKQRRAIRKWRAEKEKERSKKRTNGSKPAVPNSEDDVVARLERKQKLEEWRRKKMEEKRRCEKEIQTAKQLKAQKEHERKQLQDMKRAAVEVYKKEKMYHKSTCLMIQELKELKEREEKAAQANMLLKSFRQQDETYIERRRLYRSQQLKNKENEANRWKEVHRRAGTSTERDPERLLRPTLSWNDRLLSRSAEPSSKSNLHLRNIPHLAVPSWRRGLVS